MKKLRYLYPSILLSITFGISAMELCKDFTDSNRSVCVDLRTGKPIKQEDDMTDSSPQNTLLAFSSNGSHLMVGLSYDKISHNRNSVINVFETKSWFSNNQNDERDDHALCRFVLPDSQGMDMEKIAVSPQGSYVAIAIKNYPFSIKLFVAKINSTQSLSVIPSENNSDIISDILTIAYEENHTNKAYIQDLAFNMSENLLATSDGTSKINLWKLDNQKYTLLKALNDQVFQVQKCIFSPCDQFLAVRSNTDQGECIKIWNIQEGTHKNIDISDGKITDNLFSYNKNGSALIVSGLNRLLLYNTKDNTIESISLGNKTDNYDQKSASKCVRYYNAESNSVCVQDPLHDFYIFNLDSNTSEKLSGNPLTIDNQFNYSIKSQVTDLNQSFIASNAWNQYLVVTKVARYAKKEAPLKEEHKALPYHKKFSSFNTLFVTQIDNNQLAQTSLFN